MSQQFPLSANSESPIKSHLNHNNSYCLFYYYSKIDQSTANLKQMQINATFSNKSHLFSPKLFFSHTSQLTGGYIQCSQNPFGFWCNFSSYSPTTFTAHAFDKILRRGIFFLPFTCYALERSSLPWTDSETWINGDTQHLLTPLQELKSLLPKPSRFLFSCW